MLFRRKRKIDAVTCYADKVSELEKLESHGDLTATQFEKCLKAKRRIKNRLSSFKSREKKRMHLETLQKEALDLEKQIQTLNRENWALRHPPHASMLPSRPASRSLHADGVLQTTNAPNNRQKKISCTPKIKQTRPSCVSSRDNANHTLSRKWGIPPQPLSRPVLHDPKPVKRMHPCVLRPVCSAPRPHASVSAVVKQSCMHWDIPWETMGSMFWTLGKLSLALIEKQKERGAVAEFIRRQQYLSRIFCQILMSFSRKQCLLNEVRYDRERSRRAANIMFTRITRKFLLKATSKHRSTNRAVPLTYYTEPVSRQAKRFCRAQDR